MSVTSNEKVLIFVGLIAIVLDILLANGCAFEPVLASNGGEATQTALYIIAENTFSVEKSSGEDAVLVAVVVRNASGRRIEFLLPTASFYGVIGRELDTAFENVRYASSEGILGRGRALTGSFDYVAFDCIVALEPGETIELALRADIPSGAANRIEVGLGDAGMLLTDSRYADTGDFVADELIVGNASVTRHFVIRQ